MGLLCKFLKGETPSDLPVEQLLIRPECALKKKSKPGEDRRSGRRGPDAMRLGMASASACAPLVLSSALSSASAVPEFSYMPQMIGRQDGL